YAIHVRQLPGTDPSPDLPVRRWFALTSRAREAVSASAPTASCPPAPWRDVPFRRRALVRPVGPVATLQRFRREAFAFQQRAAFDRSTVRRKAGTCDRSGERAPTSARLSSARRGRELRRPLRRHSRPPG